MNDWSGELTIGLGWVYYRGPVGDTEFHQHYAAQICFPFNGPLNIETLDGNQTVRDILVVGSNVSHRLSSSSPTSQLLYLDPNMMRKSGTRLKLNEMVVLDFSVSQMQNIRTALEIDATQMDSDFGKRVANLIWPEEVESDAFASIDPRITRALAEIESSENLNMTLGQLIENSGLSESRFRHLFSTQVGMSLKSYLLWTKLQRAIQSLATDSSLTRASHAAGFSDSAHLSRTFRRVFGLAPTDLNKNAHFTTRNKTP